jgi:hypothetical protein
MHKPIASTLCKLAVLLIVCTKLTSQANSQDPVIISAKTEFLKGSGYRLATGKQAFDILEQVGGKEPTAAQTNEHAQKTAPLPTVLEQYRSDSFRPAYLAEVRKLYDKLKVEFVPSTPGLPGDTYKELKDLLHSTEADADGKEYGFRRFPDAELMHTSKRARAK